MLTKHIEGQPLDAIRSFSANDMLGLFRARFIARRQQCCLLAWNAITIAIDAIK